jgi:hypothetical protein
MGQAEDEAGVSRMKEENFMLFPAIPSLRRVGKRGNLLTTKEASRPPCSIR